VDCLRVVGEKRESEKHNKKGKRSTRVHRRKKKKKEMRKSGLERRSSKRGRKMENVLSGLEKSDVRLALKINTPLSRLFSIFAGREKFYIYYQLYLSRTDLINCLDARRFAEKLNKLIERKAFKGITQSSS
jgi:hypothetical protein